MRNERPANKTTAFAEKMRRLVNDRAGRQPLPAGYTRCPLNPSHQVPTAAIVTHLERAHMHDDLAAAPNAMYGSGTYARREKFIQMQLHRHTTATTTTTNNNNNNNNEINNNNQLRRHTRRRRYSGRSSSVSSTSSSCSSECTSHRGGRHRPRRRYSHNNINNNNFTAGNNVAVGALHTLLPQQQQQQPLPLSFPTTTNTTALYAPTPTPAVVVGAKTTTPTRMIIGRYSLGSSIAWQSLINYMRQFGSVLQTDAHPQTATFAVVYDTIEAASRCLAESYPSVVIDGVPVVLSPSHSPAEAARGGTWGGREAEFVSTRGHSHKGQQLPQQYIQTPSVIRVGGTPVAVTMLGNSDSRITTDNNNSSNNIVSNSNDSTSSSMIAAGRRSARIEPPRRVFIAELNKDRKEKEDEELHVRRIWEEFVRFGDVANIVVVGPRVIVEFTSHESVDKVTEAMKRDSNVFTCCSPLK